LNNPSDKTPANWREQMRRDWDTRARENARIYINWPGIPNEEEAFIASGREDYARYIKPFFARHGLETSQMHALEIGCGIGRLARCLAAEFAQVTGVDVSQEMVARATAANLPHARFLAVSGGDLQGVADGSVDFVMSFAVFQHVPEHAAIVNYVRETARVLKPGGYFRLHMKGLRTLALGRYLVECGYSLNQRFLRSGLTRVPIARVRYLDTWQGISLPPPEARRICASFGLQVLEVECPWTIMQWVSGRKPPA